MSAKGMLVAMVGGAALVVFLSTRRTEPVYEETVPTPRADDSWLTREATAQLFGPEGTLGPLFEGVTLGGPAPSPEVRKRIEDFAHKNKVEIGLDVEGDRLAAVRVVVTFGGCCGYEGADTLSLKLGRRSTGFCCVCGPDTWINDWTIAREDGTFMHGHVRVNEVSARWQKTLTTPEMIDTAEKLVGMNALELRDRAPDRWSTLESGRSFRYEVPYPFVPFLDLGAETPMTSRHDLGMVLVVDHGIIDEVSFALRGLGEAEAKALNAELRKRWGKPRLSGDFLDTQTWQPPGRTVTASIGGYSDQVTLKRRP
jgi:hypothetical protein